MTEARVYIGYNDKDKHKQQKTTKDLTKEVLGIFSKNGLYSLSYHHEWGVYKGEHERTQVVTIYEEPLEKIKKASEEIKTKLNQESVLVIYNKKVYWI